MSPREKTTRHKMIELRLLAKLAKGPVETFDMTIPERGRLRDLEVEGKIRAQELSNGTYAWELIPEKE